VGLLTTVDKYLLACSRHSYLIKAVCLHGMC